MSIESENIKRWIKTAKENKSKYVLDIMDGFDYSHYPVYVSEDEDLTIIKGKYSSNMQQVYGVYTVESKD